MRKGDTRMSRQKPIPTDRVVIIETKKGKTIAIWNEPSQEFVMANQKAVLYKGKRSDTYFATDYINERDIIDWAELC